MTTAQVILQQLGGRQFLAMTGTKNLLDTGKGLRMKLARNKSKASHLQIDLDADDTYTVRFMSFSNKKLEWVTVKEFEGVYWDMLKGIFESTTELYTSLN